MRTMYSNQCNFHISGRVLVALLWHTDLRCVCVAANVPTVLIAQMQHYIDHRDAKYRPSKDAPIESARGRRRLLIAQMHL